MFPRMSLWLSRARVFRTLVSHMRLATRLIREPRVPLLAKTVPLLTAAYIVSPIDLLPDVIPVIGQLDDLTVLLVALEAFLRISPPVAVGFHRDAIASGRRYAPMAPTDDVIDAEWRRSG